VSAASEVDGVSAEVFPVKARQAFFANSGLSVKTIHPEVMP